MAERRISNTITLCCDFRNSHCRECYDLHNFCQEKKYYLHMYDTQNIFFYSVDTQVFITELILNNVKTKDHILIINGKVVNISDFYVFHKSIMDGERYCRICDQEMIYYCKTCFNKSKNSTSTKNEEIGNEDTKINNFIVKLDLKSKIQMINK